MGKKIGAALSDGESGPDFNSVDDVAKMKARLKKSYPQPFGWPLTAFRLGAAPSNEPAANRRSEHRSNSRPS